MNDFLPILTLICKIVLAVFAFVGFCLQSGIFVKPVDLEKKHREIMEESYKKFASINAVDDLKQEFKEIKSKIDQIYEMLLQR